MRLNSGQPASERREGVKPRLALIGGVEAGATIADIQTTAATEQLLPLNPANRRIRTRTYGGWEEEGRSRKAPPYPVCGGPEMRPDWLRAATDAIRRDHRNTLAG